MVPPEIKISCILKKMQLPCRYTKTPAMSGPEYSDVELYLSPQYAILVSDQSTVIIMEYSWLSRRKPYHIRKDPETGRFRDLCRQFETKETNQRLECWITK